jgi:MFS family permease
MSFTSARSRWPDVYLSAGARGVSIAGDLLAATALALALQSAGAGGLAVSGLLIAAVLPLVVLAPLAGRLVDRVDSRTLLVAVGSAQAGICTALAYADRPAVIVALVALLACGLAITQPTLAALLPAMVHRDDLPRAAAITQTATSVAALAAPALAGFLVGQFGVRLPVFVNAASYLAVVAAGLLMRTRRGGAPAPADTATTQQVAGRGLNDDPLLRAMTLAIAGVLAGVAAINVIAVFFIRETLNASATTYGLVEAAWTAGMLAGTWLLSQVVRRVRDDGAAVQGVLAMLAGTSALILAGAAVPGAFWLLPLWLAGGVLNGGENVFSNVVIGRRAAPEARGRVFATYVGTVQGASMIGYFAGGLLLEWTGPRLMVALAGLAGVLMVMLFVVPVRRAATAVGWGTVAVTGGIGADHGGYRAHHGRSGGPPQGGAHPVPQLPADLLGADAFRRVDRRRPAQGHARSAQCGAGRR